jgi:amidophosphoribosyltransferase
MEQLITLDDHPVEECGVFGIFGHSEAANLAYLGLHALQHRGQEAAGIASLHKRRIYVHRALGLVQEAFSSATLSQLAGAAAVGHVRYSTAGGKSIRNAQPLCADCARGSIALAHNGTLTNAHELRQRLERAGSIFQTTGDSEVLVHLVARASAPNLLESLLWALPQIRGAYSLVVLTQDSLIAARDPRGIRPLCLGFLNGAAVVASESNAFNLVGATFERDVAPGEVLVVDHQGLTSNYPMPRQDPALCIFEYIYFARPDSTIGGRSVYEARKDLGRQLFREHPVEADVVVPVPDSGTPSAIGFSQAGNIPFELALIRSHYVGRTFIEPQSSIRHFGVKLKLSPVRACLAGKRVVVVDDSVVRGTTSRKIVTMLREAGAREVHLRISSPPTRWPCFYGIDTPSREELLAAELEPEAIARKLGADSIGYLSIEGTKAAVGGTGYCDACFSGHYPEPIPPQNRTSRSWLIGV